MSKIEEDDDLRVKKDKKKKNNGHGTIFRKLSKKPKVRGILLRLIPWVIIVLFFTGIVLFVINMPGMVLESIEEWGRNILGNVQKFFNGDDSIKITEKEVVSLAQHLQDMGYDVTGYGLGNPIYEKDANGNDTNTPKSRNIRGKVVTKIGESVDGKNYLRSYIAANEHTYTLAENSVMGFFQTLPSRIGSVFGLSDFESGESKSTGLIHIVGANADSVKKFVEIDREGKQLKIYSSASAPSESLGFLSWLNPFNPLNGAIVDGAAGLITGSDSSKSGNTYSYDLENWVARYGRPTELFLSLHLSTMMPDLTYEIATAEEFNTKVELAMMPLNATYEVSATKGDETIEGKQITDLYEQQVGSLSYLKDLIDNTDEVIKQLTEHGDADKLIPSSNWTYREIAELQAIAKKSPKTRNITNQSITTTNNSALTEAPKPFDSVTEDDGHFTKYTNLSDDQVRDIAKVCCREQGNESLRAIAGEASLMANLFEKSRGSNYYMKHGAKHSTDTIYDFVRCDTWFGGDDYRSEETMGYPDGDPNNQVTDDAVNIVNQVLVKGKRTLPIYILEHDSPIDLSYVETNGERHEDVNNHNNYVKDQSIVQQNPARIPDGGQWTFYCFLSDTSDPFGYYEKTDEEFHYILDEDSDLTSNSSGSFDMLWPFLTGVKNHWFYEDIDFTKNVYRFAKDAKKVIGYKSEDENSPLNKNKVDVKLNATLTSSMGIIYQVAEPSAMGPNERILKIFDGEYYRYDGTTETAKKIANAKAGELNKTTFSFDGQDGIAYNKSLSEDTKKQKVSFENNKLEALTAFGILENTHTEASDYIYRNLKELMLYRKYFTSAELTNEIEQIMLWPIKTEDQFTTWDTILNTRDYGTTINCNKDEKIVLAPSDALIKEINGNEIRLQFTTLNEEDADLLTYIWQYKDPYTKINRDILTGTEFVIKDVKLKDTLKVGDKIKRGDMLGEAAGKSGEKTSINIAMYNLDKSVVQDINTYLREEENSKYEELMKVKRENKKTLGEKQGYDITAFLSSMQNVRHTSGDLSIVTTTWMSKDEFVKRARDYSDREFAQYLESIYDVCMKNNINPVLCATQAWLEQGWVAPYAAQYNYWGLGIYNGMQTSTFHFDSIEESTQAWCDNLNQRIKAEENDDHIGNLAESIRLAPYNDKFTGGINNIYDVYSNYAAPDYSSGPQDDANFMVEYIDLLLEQAKYMFGEDAF